MLIRHGRRGVADHAEIISGDQMTYAGVERINVWYLAAGCVQEERRLTTFGILQLPRFVAYSNTWTAVDVVGSKESDQQQRQNDRRTYTQND